MAQTPKKVNHVVAGVVRSGHEVNPADGVNVSVVFPVTLLPIATVHPYRPQLKHLSQDHRHHHKQQIEREIAEITGMLGINRSPYNIPGHTSSV